MKMQDTRCKSENRSQISVIIFYFSTGFLFSKNKKCYEVKRRFKRFIRGKRAN